MGVIRRILRLSLIVAPLVLSAVVPACASSKTADAGDSGVFAIDDAGLIDTGHTTFDSSPEPVDGDDDDATVDAPSDDGSPSNDAGDDGDAGDGAPLVDSCTPSPLACDGIDHNCNGTVDQGCPASMSFGLPMTAGTLWGNPTGGMPFADSCPAGQVLIGVQGQVGTSIDGIGGLCGIVSINESTATTPYTYTVAIVPGSLLPEHLGVMSTAFTRQCPANQAVVKVSGQAGQLIDGFVVTCAPLVISGTVQSFTVAQGTPTTDLNFIGGTGGSPFAPFACPSTQIATAIGGRNGNSLDALSFSCGTPALTLR